MEDEVIGYVVGKSTIEEVTILMEKSIRVGEYVIFEYGNEKVLGVVTSISAESPVFDEDLNNIEVAKKIRKMDRATVFLKAKAKLLCRIEDFKQPILPPFPGTEVKIANEQDLAKIFSNGDIRIGTLIGRNVEVKINVNALTRHLAILATTGSGKSNTVAVLSSRFAELGGTVLIFDYHGEYYNSDIKKLNPVDPLINPLHLSPSEFASLLEIRNNASRQQRILRKAFKIFIDETKKKLEKGSISYSSLDDVFFDLLSSKILEIARGDPAGDEVVNKLDDFLDRYEEIINFAIGTITDRLKQGFVNVIDLSSVGEEIVDPIMANYLKKILYERKKNKVRGKGGLEFPIVNVIEEAHVFLSKDENRSTKYWAKRIAREGRKFGVGLIIVSQRPKGIDENILSQMTNKIILKIVEPSDKRYILEASDNLSQDLVNSLSSLNTGEAIIIGNIVKIPAMVKIDKFEGKLGGEEPPLLPKKDDNEGDFLDFI